MKQLTQLRIVQSGD